MDIKLTLTFDEVVEKFLPNLPPETGVSIELEKNAAEPTPLPPLATEDGVVIGAFDEKGKLCTYRDTFDFGEALKRLKQGKKVARKGWNGKEQFVYYIPADRYAAKTEAAKSIAAGDGKVDYRAYLALRTAQGDVATWVPSISDCLAEDWKEVK